MQVVATLKSAVRYRCKASGRDIVWQNGFHDRIVREDERADQYVAYVLDNPVRKQIVKRYQDYPFCGRIDEA
jgi:hypothetical protein